jgi:beta-lactamase class A
MMTQTTRRRFLIGGAVLAAGGCAHAQDAPEAAVTDITEIERKLGGRIGVSALETGSGRRIRHRADERFAMCSTFKAPLAGAVLSRIDRGEMDPAEMLRFDPENLLPTSPVSTAHADAAAIPVLAACEAVVSHSDNTAANLLLEKIGGPPALTEFFRSLGDDVTRLDRYEMELNSNIPGDERDTTAPDAMLGSLETILLGEALSPASRARLTEWMLNEQNGKARIRAGAPAGWRVANKPGTGAGGATNEIGILWPPVGAPIAIAVYVKAPDAEPTARQAAIAETARAVAAAFG